MSGKRVRREGGGFVYSTAVRKLSSAGGRRVVQLKGIKKAELKVERAHRGGRGECGGKVPQGVKAELMRGVETNDRECENSSDGKRNGRAAAACSLRRTA